MGIQGYAWVYNGYTRVYKGLHRYTRVYCGIQGYTMGMLGYTRVYMGF